MASRPAPSQNPSMDPEFYRRAFVIAAAVLLGYALLRMFEALWTPMAWAAFLAFLLYPLHRWLTRKLRGRAGLSAIAMTILTPVLIIGPLLSLGFVFANQVASLVEYLQRQGRRFDFTPLRELERYPAIGVAARWIRENVTITAEQVQEWAVTGAQNLLKAAAAVGGNVFLGAVGTIFGFVIMLFLLFFFLRDGRELAQHGINLVPMQPERRQALTVQLGKVTRAVVYGSGLTALIQGALVGLGFGIAGLKAPVVFGVLAAFTAFIPSVGTGIVLVPAIAWLLFAQRWGAAIFMAVWTVVVGFSDNLLRPMLVARQTEVSALTVFLGAIGGVAAFGFIGLFLGPLLLSLIGTLLVFLEESLRQGRETVR